MQDRRCIRCITLCSSFFSVSNFSEKLLLLVTSFPSRSISCRRLSFATSNQKMSWPGAWRLWCFSSHCFVFFSYVLLSVWLQIGNVSEITSGVDANGVAKLADFGLACPMRLEETPNKLGKKRGVKHFQLGLTKSLSQKSVGSEIS